MKLELKHLAPYLPYGVHLMNKYGRWHNTTLNKGLSIYQMLEMKPILRPLSDLRDDKESIVELKLFVHADLLWTIDGAINGNYESVQYLLSKHYDVFGLIEAGLAIDINTLKK